MDKEHEAEFLRHIKRDASTESLLSLELDEGSKIGYTLKCVGSGFWALCSSNDFKHMINLLVREGGDADTYMIVELFPSRTCGLPTLSPSRNGAVCGALWGARYGYSALPRDWLAAMPNKAWLDRKVVRFLNLLGITNVEQAIIERSYEERTGTEETIEEEDDSKDAHWI